MSLPKQIISVSISWTFDSAVCVLWKKHLKKKFIDLGTVSSIPRTISALGEWLRKFEKKNNEFFLFLHLYLLELNSSGLSMHHCLLVIQSVVSTHTTLAISVLVILSYLQLTSKQWFITNKSPLESVFFSIRIC